MFVALPCEQKLLVYICNSANSSPYPPALCILAISNLRQKCYPALLNKVNSFMELLTKNWNVSYEKNQGIN